MARKRSNKRQSRIPTRAAGRQESGHSHEIIGIVTLGFSIFATAALLSLQLGEGTLMGPLGRSVAIGGYGLLGCCAYGVVALMSVASVRLLLDRRPIVRPKEAISLAIGALSLATLLHLALSSYRVAGHAAGGLAGEHLAEVLRAMISTAGTALLAVIGLAIAIVIATPFRMRQVLDVMFSGAHRAWLAVAAAGAAVGRTVSAGARAFGRGVHAAAATTAEFCGEVLRAILPERDEDEYAAYDSFEGDDEDLLELKEGDDPAFEAPPIIESGHSGRVAVPISGDTERMDEAQIAEVLEAAVADNAGKGKKKPKKNKPAKKKNASKKASVTIPGVAVSGEIDADDEDADVEAGAVEEDSIEVDDARAPAVTTTAAMETVAPVAETSGPEIVEPQFRKKAAQDMQEAEKHLEAQRRGYIKHGDGAFELPPTRLLDYDASQIGQIDRDAMLETSARLAEVLSQFKVKGEVTAIRPGPVVTMYEFAPAPGTRLNKITVLQHEVAMALGATGVRIVAPIPGKTVVGFEIPNDSRETVFLKEIIADDVFQKAKSNLTMALGKDIDGAPVACDLAKMPHLLVAGTTGSGKSVSVNSMIVSLLYNASPEDVRLIMVDPKMLELSIYEGIPHLLLPVVTDPKKANLALRWAVEEMERRYEALAALGVRDIATYNRKLEKLQAAWEAEQLERAAEEARRRAEEDEELEVTEERGQLDLEFDGPPKRLPKIVVIIDEFADLMMCAPKEVETSVARIAQKARAAGIHLIIATQRPSVDVITGLIKANFPSRIAFRVSSRVDSRTILDSQGAEALLGMGDMLFADRGRDVRRVHGCYVGEDEIREVVEHLKTQGKPVYNLDIIRPREDDPDAPESDEEVDEVYDRAVSLVAESRKVSISMIQRRLRIGYNRAARIVEAMQDEGVVSTPDHQNKREVLLPPAA